VGYQPQLARGVYPLGSGKGFKICCPLKTDARSQCRDLVEGNSQRSKVEKRTVKREGENLKVFQSECPGRREEVAGGKEPKKTGKVSVCLDRGGSDVSFK